MDITVAGMPSMRPVAFGSETAEQNVPLPDHFGTQYRELFTQVVHHERVGTNLGHAPLAIVRRKKLL